LQQKDRERGIKELKTFTRTVLEDLMRLISNAYIYPACMVIMVYQRIKIRYAIIEAFLQQYKTCKCSSPRSGYILRIEKHRWKTPLVFKKKFTGLQNEDLQCNNQYVSFLVEDNV